MDIDKYNQQVQDIDPATVVQSKPIETVKTIPAVLSSAVLQTRRYDLNITYDKYYQTPRLVLLFVCLFVCLFACLLFVYLSDGLFIVYLSDGLFVVCLFV